MLHWRGADIADMWRRGVEEGGPGVLFSGFGYQSCLHRRGIVGGLERSSPPTPCRWIMDCKPDLILSHILTPTDPVSVEWRTDNQIIVYLSLLHAISPSIDSNESMGNYPIAPVSYSPNVPT